MLQTRTRPEPLWFIATLAHVHVSGDETDGRYTVVENLAFHAAIWGRASTFEPILAELKLERVAHMRARYLSAGQRRRVALAMLMLQGARVWLLDEPTTNLDSEGRALLVEWTRRHVAAGGIAVIATHQPDEFAARGALMIELS